MGGIVIAWVARDKNGLLCAYSHKPSKSKGIWIENSEDNSININSLCVMPEDWFQEIKWSDDEPRELVLKPINKKWI